MISQANPPANGSHQALICVGKGWEVFFWLTGHKKGDIANKYLLYKVYMGLIIEGTSIFPMNW